MWDPKDVGRLVAEVSKSESEVPCNISGLIRNMMIDMETMSAEINSLKERVYTLEGLAK